MSTPPAPALRAPAGWIGRLIALGFLLSGLAGLVDEVVWSKALALLLGGTTLTHTLVLATFMGGLAIGNALFGRIADRDPRPLLLYARLELGVGLLCLAFPEIFGAASDAYVVLARHLPPGSPALLPLKVALAAVAVLLPTIAMGGTLPVLARAVVQDLKDVTASIAGLYTVNSVGAVAGVVVGAFWWIPALGLDGAIRVSALVNLALAAAFWLADRQTQGGRSFDHIDPGPSARPAPAGTEQSKPRPAAFSQAQRRVVLGAIAVSGAVSMLYELVWTRVLSLVLGSSTYSFSIMLLTFISGIAAGSWAVGRAAGERTDPVRWFAWAEVGVFASVLPVVPLVDRLPFTFASLASLLPREPAFFPLYLTLKVLIAFVLLFLPAFFVGMTLPLASRVRVEGLAVLGRRVGSVFSVNTLGTVVGAVLTGLVLIPAWGLRATLELGLVLSALLGAALAAVSSGGLRLRVGLPAGVVVALLLAALLPPWNPLALHFGLFRHKQFAAESFEALMQELAPFEVLSASDGADTSVAVIRDTRTDNLYLKVNGKTDAGTGQDMTTQLWLGHLGMFLNPQAGRALVVGLGSGITAGSVLAHPGVVADVVEIAEEVVDAARYFAGANGDVLTNPRLRLHLGDAKELIALRPDARWDLIVSEPSNPWIAGIGALFSRETFAAYREGLAPGGVLVQWIHLYELDDDLLRLILDTIGAVFPHVEVWQCNTWDALLVASVDPIVPDPAAISARLADPRVAADLNRPGLRQAVSSVEALLLHQALSAGRFRALFGQRARVNADWDPLLEYAAPRAFFVGGRSELIWHLDERLRPLARSDLHVAALLRARRLGPDALDEVVEGLEARGGVPDEALLRSLAWGLHLLAPTGAQARRLVPGRVEAALAEAALDTGTIEGLVALARVLEQATSVLFSPRTEGLRAALDARLAAADAALAHPDVVRTLWPALVRLGWADLLAAWPSPSPDLALPDPLGLLPGVVPAPSLRAHLLETMACLDAPPGAGAPLPDVSPN